MKASPAHSRMPARWPARSAPASASPPALPWWLLCPLPRTRRPLAVLMPAGNTGMQIYISMWQRRRVACRRCATVPAVSTVFTHDQKSHAGRSGRGSPPLLPVRVRPHLRACLGAAPGAGIAAPRPYGAHCDRHANIVKLHSSCSRETLDLARSTAGAQSWENTGLQRLSGLVVRASCLMFEQAAAVSHIFPFFHQNLPRIPGDRLYEVSALQVRRCFALTVGPSERLT